MERKPFIAGSTGAVGRTLVRLADARGAALVPHLRPRHERDGRDPRAAVLELADTEALERALAGCTTVVQLIGTMRSRFAAGDTYETSDIGTTRQLVAAAKRAPSVDHIVLLSSVGAGRPVGAYLKAKAAAEAIVRDAGIPWTIFRPSAFEGEGHKPPAVLGGVTRLLRLDRWRPIGVEALAAAILRSALARAPLAAVLEGRSLWEWVDQST
ncbi:MAG TPA: NAD(P)H-binding protein [Haliangiales bacterium]|nr:NAD(P)H-binding protein [Haliangiales bacterium]